MQKQTFFFNSKWFALITFTVICGMPHKISSQKYCHTWILIQSLYACHWHYHCAHDYKNKLMLLLEFSTFTFRAHILVSKLFSFILYYFFLLTYILPRINETSSMHIYNYPKNVMYYMFCTEKSISLLGTNRKVLRGYSTYRNLFRMQ